MQEMSHYNSEAGEVDTALFAIIMLLKLKINLLNQTLWSNSLRWLISCQSAETKALKINAKLCLLLQPDGVIGINMVE